jgi:hypothetical protein
VKYVYVVSIILISYKVVKSTCVLEDKRVTKVEKRVLSSGLVTLLRNIDHGDI